MKKRYDTPHVEVVQFELEDVLTASGIGSGDGIADPWSVQGIEDNDTVS